MKHFRCFVLLLLSTFTFAQAGEHPLSTIQGTQIDLKTYDHALAGSIKDFVVWGHLDEGKGESALLMKKDGQVVSAEFRRNTDKTIGGVITHQASSGQKSTSIKFLKVDRPTHGYPRLILEINGKAVEIVITARDFKNNHFLDPTYELVVDGTKIQYTLKGEACLNYSLHLAFIIVGAFVHG